MSEQTLVHGTCVLLGGRGVLMLGPSGSGKSDLALRLIDAPGYGPGSEMLASRLVADDQVLIKRSGNMLTASAPGALKGLLEVRGIGVVSAHSVDHCRLDLVLQLVSGQAMERMPDRGSRRFELLGVDLPLMELDPFQVSSAAWVRAAIVAID